MVHVLSYRDYKALIDFGMKEYYGDKCAAVVTICNPHGDIEGEYPLNCESLAKAESSTRELINALTEPLDKMATGSSYRATC